MRQGIYPVSIAILLSFTAITAKAQTDRRQFLGPTRNGVYTDDILSSCHLSAARFPLFFGENSTHEARRILFV